MLSCKGKTCFFGCFSPYTNGMGSSLLYGVIPALGSALGVFLTSRKKNDVMGLDVARGFWTYSVSSILGM